MNIQRAFFDHEKHRYPTEDILTPKLAQQLEMTHLERALHIPPGSTILDFGAGSGRVTCWFLQRGYNVTAVDISTKSLLSLRQLYQAKRKKSWGKLTTSTTLPSDKRFDGIVGADILHHIDIPTELPKLYRILKPNGAIAFSEPNAWNVLWYLHYAIQRIPWHIEKGILHCTASNLKKQLSRAGFSAIHIDPHGLLPTRLFNTHPTLCRWNAFTLGNAPIFRVFAFRFILSARKA